MDIFFATMQGVLVLLGIGIAGYWIIERNLVRPTILEVLTPLVIDVAAPCMIFADIMAKFDPGSVPGWWNLPLWWLGITALIFVFTRAVERLVRPEIRREFGMSLLYPNALFFPLVIIPAIYGEKTVILTELFIFTLLFPAFLFNTYGIFFSRKGHEMNVFDWRKLLNPILVLTLLAVLLKVTGLAQWVPGFIVSVSRSIGNITLPLIMILIGGNIYLDFQKRGRFHGWPVVQFVLVKNVLLPALVFGILMLIKPPPSVAFQIFIYSAVPPVTAVPILAQRIGADASLTNQFLVASFAASVVTLPAALWAYSLFFPV